MRQWQDLDRDEQAVIRDIACNSCKGVVRLCNSHASCSAVQDAIQEMEEDNV